MNRDVLNEALREAPIPIPADAEERGRRVLAAAFEQRQAWRLSVPEGRKSASRERVGPGSHVPSLPRLALGLALATLLAALLLSPAGADVRGWVDDAFTASTPRPEPTLARIPGGGRLLVADRRRPRGRAGGRLTAAARRLRRSDAGPRTVSSSPRSRNGR